jgi:hemolysin III
MQYIAHFFYSYRNQLLQRLLQQDHFFSKSYQQHMMKKRLLYTDNEPLSAITHAAGTLLAIAGLVLLIVFSAIRGSAWHVVSFSIFGSCLVLLYAASTAYHLVSVKSKYKPLMQKIDYCMIYALIAGTYTPVCLVALRGAWGWSLFGVVWGLAIIGIIWRIFGDMPDKISLMFYLTMSWMVIVALYPIFHRFSTKGIIWLFLGGLMYTTGAVVFALESRYPRSRKWFNLHDLWHLFVMLGSFCHFAMIFWCMI